MDRTFTVKDISELLHVDVTTVRRWINGKKFKGDKTSNRVGYLICEEDLINFCKQNRQYRYALTALHSDETISINNVEHKEEPDIKKNIIKTLERMRTEIDVLIDVLES